MSFCEEFAAAYGMRGNYTTGGVRFMKKRSRVSLRTASQKQNFNE